MLDVIFEFKFTAALETKEFDLWDLMSAGDSP